VYNYTVNPMNPYINLYNTWDVCPCGRPPAESPSESTNAACWDWWMRTDEDVNQSHFGASGTINPSYQSSSVLWFGFWMLYMLLTVMTVMTLPQFGASGTIRDHQGPSKNCLPPNGFAGVQSPATGNSVSQWLRFPGHRELIIENL
jgi:hypothetical protein